MQHKTTKIYIEVTVRITFSLNFCLYDSSLFRPVINLITLFLILNAFMLTFDPPPQKKNMPISKLHMKLCETNNPEHPVAENFFFKFHINNVLAQIVA